MRTKNNTTFVCVFHDKSSLISYIHTCNDSKTMLCYIMFWYVLVCFLHFFIRSPRAIRVSVNCSRRKCFKLARCIGWRQSPDGLSVPISFSPLSLQLGFNLKKSVNCRFFLSFLLSLFLCFLSRATRPISHYVGPSVRTSVGPSVGPR